MLKRLFCKHHNITYLRPLTNAEMIKLLKKNKSATYLYKCNECGKLLYK